MTVMKRAVDLTLAAAALLVLGSLALVHSRDLPLGVVGEWRWPRIDEPWPVVGLLITLAAVIAYPFEARVRGLARANRAIRFCGS